MWRYFFFEEELRSSGMRLISTFNVFFFDFIENGFRNQFGNYFVLNFLQPITNIC